MYKALHNDITIKKSSIDGLGVFALKGIPKDTVLGISHIKDTRFENGYIRTPLGGFFNHSDIPNCKAYIDNDFIRLKTIKNISKDEELTAKYWLYKIL